jgi:hypothetical protein
LYLVEVYAIVEETPRLASLATPLSQKEGNFCDENKLW